jgi:tripartite-type tricarboxylate transporter receptor subunit TctC
MKAPSKLLAATLLLASAVHAQAQDYPSRPIRVLVPFAPGGAVDTTTRILTQKLTERLGWNITVENRPGGAGFIATQAAAKSPPDGYTLLMAHTGEFAVNPALFPNVPYELERDFMPITMVSDAPMLYLANVKEPYNNFRELVAHAKSKPDAVTFSSPGNGSINHLAGEWLAQAAGIKMLHVPYKGGAPAAVAVAAGEVSLGVMAIPGAAAHLQSGRAKVIGVTTAKRTAAGPDWPTPAEGGIKDVDVSIWVGLFAPKGTPQAIVDKLNAEVLKTLEQPEVRKRYAELGSLTAGMTPAAFLQRIKSDAERYKGVVKAAGVKPE